MVLPIKKKVSDLPALDAFNGTEIAEWVRTGSKKATAAQLLAYIQANIASGAFQPWEPGVVTAPALFTTVAEGFGAAVISNGGLTATGEPGAFVSSDAGASLLSAGLHSVVFSFDPAEIPETEGGMFFGFVNGTAPGQGMSEILAIFVMRVEGQLTVLLQNPFAEESSAPVALAFAAGEELCLEMETVAGVTTARLFHQSDLENPLVQHTFAFSYTALDRIFFYPAAAAAITLQLITNSAAGFDYTVTGAEIIDPGSYPANRAGRIYEIINRPTPTLDANFGERLQTGDVVAFTLAGAIAGFVITPASAFLSQAQADSLYQPLVKNNYNGSGPPGMSDDEDAGYSEGSKWWDLSSSPREVWICTDPYAGYAVWENITISAADLGTMAVKVAGTGALEFRTNEQNEQLFLSRASTPSQVYGTDSNGDQQLFPHGTQAENDVVVRRMWSAVPALSGGIRTRPMGTIGLVDEPNEEAVGGDYLARYCTNRLPVLQPNADGSGNNYAKRVLFLTDPLFSTVTWVVPTVFDTGRRFAEFTLINLNSSGTGNVYLQVTWNNTTGTFTVPYGKSLTVFADMGLSWPVKAFLSDITPAVPT